MGQQPGAGRSQQTQQEISYLLLVPLEVGDEHKAARRIRVLEDNPVGLSLLVKNVVHPLEGEGEGGPLPSHRPVGRLPRLG